MQNKNKSMFKLCLILAVTALFAFLAIFDFGGKSNFAASNIKQGLDLKGGVSITYEAKTDTPPTEEEMLAERTLIQERLDRQGYTEATVAQSGADRIIVEIPGVSDAEEAVKTIGATAELTFFDENNNVLLTGDDVKDAQPMLVDGAIGKEYVVQLTLTSEGSKKFEEATGNNIGKPLYIALDGEVISAPIVNQQIIGDTCTISGNFTKESATELSAQIKSGSLPFSLETISVNTVGASLGAEALSTSIKASILGITLVFIFMLCIYKTFGLVADIALVLYVGLMIFSLNFLDVTLTLPGIAGIILSIGMAVDANIIIFERIKEEVNRGRSLRSSIKAGFDRAFPAILDGNVTTLIASFILFWLGTGTVKGFAQTLAIGILLSMFTALVITKALLDAFIGLGLDNKKYYGFKEEKENKEVA